MECPHCKETVLEGARKCKFCTETFGFEGRLKDITNLFGGILTVVVSLASLGIAFLEYQGRVQAVEEKALVELDKQATAEILSTIPTESIVKAAKEGLRPQEPDFRDIPADQDSQAALQQIEELISEGNKALEHGREDEAERLFRDAARIEKVAPQIQQISEPVVSKSLGYVYLEKGEWEKAMREFQKALERDPEDAMARKGLIYAKTLSEAPVQ